MSTISNATLQRDFFPATASRRVAGILGRWWMAYMKWRLEALAISQLQSGRSRTRKWVCPVPRAVCSQAWVRFEFTAILRFRRRHDTRTSIDYPPPRRRPRAGDRPASRGGASMELLAGHGRTLRWRHRALRPEGADVDGEHVWLADEAARPCMVDGTTSRSPRGIPTAVVSRSTLRWRGRTGRQHALYEPSAFHLLRQMGEHGAAAFAEIAGVANRVSQGVAAGDYRGSVSAFVDYWNGSGAWDALRPSVQASLLRWAPKGPLDFWALMEEPTPSDAYRALEFPVLVLRGEHAPAPTRVIADGLSALLPNSRRMVIDGAGHMGPLTHAPEVPRDRATSGRGLDSRCVGAGDATRSTLRRCSTPWRGP